MKNKKLIKIIAASIVCSSMALTAFSFAACNPDNGGEGDSGPHYHTYSTGNDWAYDGANHWRYATCEHTDKIAYKAPHTWENDTCTVCNAVKKLIKPTLSEEDEEPPATNPDGTINVKYEFSASNYDAMTYDEGFVSGIFSIGNGTTLRTKTPQNLYSYNETDGKQLIKPVPEYTKSVKIGGSADSIEINAPAAGTLVIHVGNGSGSTLNNQLWLTKPGGAQESLSYYAEGASGPCVEVKIQCDEAGKYKITRQGGTSDIYYLSYSAKVEDSPVENIGIAAAGTVNYFVGQEFSVSGLAVNATHETTGRISPVDNRRLLIDYTNFNNTKSGTYEIIVSYTKAGRTYQTSYNVNVYSFEDLTLGTDKIVKAGSNTSASNGVYENHSLRQFYFTGETLSTDGISVILNGKIDGKAQDFLLKDTQYKISEADLSTPGKKTVTVSYTTGGVTKSKTFDVIVAENDASLATATEVKVAVNPTTSDTNVGVKNTDGAYQFKTIKQSLDFLNNAGLSKTAKKTMTLAAGTYWEKLEITVPNLTIEGAGRDNTKIEYDSLYGIKDDGGFEHTTDSTATLNVREAAENFTIKGVTVSNYWNSQEVFDRDLGAGYGEHRALALLVQSDKFTMDNCNLLGYQDTVEFFTGRQFIMNSFIAGTTDFIFGSNNTTYFYNCEIHSISNGKTDGGYITAFKGCNKDASDSITYGAIFDKCHFTADAEVVANGNTALGRPWGAYAAVAVINSEIDGHVSTETSDFVKNQRYVNMSVKPDASTVKFVEYNNTGDGAIDTAVAGMRFLTPDEAKDYGDFTVIFGTTNDKVTYPTTWIPVKPGVQTHDVTITAVTDDGNVNLGTLTVEDGGTLSMAALTAILASTDYAHCDINGVYTNAACTGDYEFDLSSGINEDGELFVKLVEGPFSTDTNYNFRVSKDTTYNVTEGSKNFGKLKVDANEGKFINNGGDWYQIQGNATLTLPLKADTVVTVTSYDDGLSFTLNGAPVDVTFKNYTYVIEVREAGTLVIGRKANGYLGSIKVDCDAGLSMTKATVTLYDVSTTVGTLQPWTGNTITEPQLTALMSEVTAPAGKEFDAFYADSGCLTPFDFTVGISADTPVYIGWKNLPTELNTIGADVTYSFANADSDVATGEKLVNNMLVTGSVVCNGSGWSLISNGGSLKIKIAERTVVTVTTHSSGSALNLTTCENYSVESANSVYTVTALKDCELLISGDGAYISTVVVDYKHVFTETTTIDLAANLLKDDLVIQSKRDYLGVEVDASNGKLGKNQAAWAQFNNGTVLTIYVGKGADVTVSCTTYTADIAIIDHSHLADGYITITSSANDYIGTVSIVYNS